MNDSQVSVGQRLKQARKLKGFNQEQVGQAVGLGKSAVSQMESGLYNLSTDYAVTISKLLNINVSWLLTGEGEAPKAGGNTNTNTNTLTVGGAPTKDGELLYLQRRVKDLETEREDLKTEIKDLKEQNRKLFNKLMGE